MTDDFHFEGNNTPDPIQPPQPAEIPPVPQVQPPESSTPQQGWFPPAQQVSPQPGPYQVPQQQPYQPQQSYQQPSYQSPYPPVQPPQVPPAGQPYNYYQQQQPGYTPPYYPPPVKKGEGLAVASLIMGIISVVTCCVITVSAICAILALVFGIVARSKGAGGMALAGIILGAAGLILSICLILLVVLSPDFMDEVYYYSDMKFAFAHLNK